MNWRPISKLNLRVMQFVLVHQDGATRLHLWNPDHKVWETGRPGELVRPGDECSNPTHFMELPENPTE